jgi:hypothetical protein
MVKTIAELKKQLAGERCARLAAEDFAKAEAQRADRAERAQNEMAREIVRLRELLEKAESRA